MGHMETNKLGVSFVPRTPKVRRPSWLARPDSVASQQVLSSILIRSEFLAVGVKKILYARREAQPSRTFSRIMEVSLPG